MSLDAVGSAAQRRLGDVVVKRMELAPPPARYYAGSIALLVLAVALGGLGGWLAVAESVIAGSVCLVLAAPLAGLGVFGLVRRAALRCALTVHEEGIVVSRKGTDAVIPYSEVRDFSLKEEARHDNGTHAGILRSLTFVWPGGSTQVAQFASVKAEDRFGPVMARILDKLADKAEARLATGASLGGKGWALDSQGLHADGQQPVRLRDLAGSGMFEGKVSFWRPGEELPFLSIPEASPNVRLLGTLAQRQSTGRERPMAGALGRILFQKKVGTVGLFLSWGFAGCFFLGGLWGIIGFALGGGWVESALFLVIGWSVALWLAAHALGRFRVYELGVTRKSLFGTRTLRYSELTSFQFGATRNYYNGAYAGTTVNMRFTPGPGAKAIRHNQTIQGNDSDLDMLRDQVADIVAGHLLERLKQGEEILWGPTARFTKDGLVVRASKLFGKGEERLAPYNAGLGFNIEQGTFHLFIGNETKAAMSVACAADNFYPGMKMLGALVPPRSKVPRIAV
ncbi:hypothetical protein [Vitiosangium sp. GDMCC 1.1324]|uniref:hypothetical protein n=1 Tax=Vitiosangium sp. (strain GDMCC 1.1324) TaxID=2138576 RepID=UPI000D3B1789|nr:hypothetical protein [Vitiosangium sp. GDMCC 1.1324]PTL85308.1 hypothetical protein DAT35_00865 [Vitiosangium sp. GDMCC 1.1324]